MSPSTTSRVTTDHEEIRRWAEARGAQPAAVIRTERDDDLGILRLDFPGYSGAGSLEQISWDEWFKQFDERKLALLYQEETAGGQKSNFNKIVSRETAQEVESAVGGRGRSARRSTSRADATAGAARSASRRGGRRTAATGGRVATKKRSASRSRGSAGRTASARTANRHSRPRSR